MSLAQPVRSNIPVESHCRLWAKQLSACNSVLSAGTKIIEDIECCPHTTKFADALKECPTATNLTLLPTSELSIKSGNFQATIPCIDQTEIPAIFPDPQQHPATLEFLQALERAGSIANDRNRLILYSSVKLMPGSITATNGDVILEAWHGSPGPQGIVPKLFIKALSRVRGKAVYSLGNSDSTITAHYADGSWIKSRLQHDPDFPNLQGFLGLQGPSVNYQPVPLGLWAAVERLAPFASDDRIYLRKEGITTNTYETDGAINLCEGLPDGISFQVSSLRLIEDFAEHIAFNVTPNMSYFYSKSKNVRGAIAQQVI